LERQKSHKDGDGLKTLRAQLLLWGLTLALVPTLFFVVWFFRYGLVPLEVLAPYPELSMIAGSAVGVFLFLMALIYWGYRWIVNPIRQLTDAAKAIREGDFDYQMEARLLFQGPLEMRELCYTFARMTEKINGQIRSMEKVNEILAQKEERWQLALHGNKDGIWDWNMETDEWVQSDRCLEMFGFLPGEGPDTREELIASVHPEDLPSLLQKLEDHLEQIAPYYEAEYRRQCKDGSYKWVLDRGQALWNDYGKPVRMVGSFTDIAERKLMEERLIHISMRDSLTGLYNRTYFQEELRRLNDGRYTPIAVIVCDVDGLKLYNDSFGHLMGDRLIKAAADILLQTFRTGDVVARIGGDEFAILLPRASRETAEAILLRLKNSIGEFNSDNDEFMLSLSTGMAIGHSKKVNLTQLFREADNNMYREKNINSQQSRAAITKTVVRLLERRDYGELGFSPEKIKDIKLLSEYHDLGKVGIADHILFKNAPLSLSETKEIQRHCEIGYRIAQSVPEIRHIAEWILRHQEWWNGKGYPLGLIGDQIPLECRVLAIADAYDTMTSERPYRAALSHDAAMKELRRGAGEQFDPFLVEMFSRIDPRRCLQQVG
jgi:diguanylate cyclase (GGDEF)-like protein/PAS domain S-box-containing protein